MNALAKVAPLKGRTSKLKAVAPKAAEPTKPKILIYGKPGVGKTWGALDFPQVFYIDTEGGADLGHYTDKLERAGGVYFGPEQGALSFEEVIGQLAALASEDHPYKTVVIDSISKLIGSEIGKEQERLGDKDQFGASKKSATAFQRRLINWIDRIDMNVILIAHEIPEWDVVKGERAQIGQTFDAWTKIEYELHLALQVTKQGTNRIARVRKSRLLEFPEASTFPWSYDEFADRYGRNIIEKEVVAIDLASPEQVAEIARLLEVVKLPDGMIEKWLTAAKATSFEEVDSDKAAKIINALRDKLAA